MAVGVTTIVEVPDGVMTGGGVKYIIEYFYK
jgi:hypothetical protein